MVVSPAGVAAMKPVTTWSGAPAGHRRRRNRGEVGADARVGRREVDPGGAELGAGDDQPAGVAVDGGDAAGAQGGGDHGADSRSP